MGDAMASGRCLFNSHGITVSKEIALAGVGFAAWLMAMSVAVASDPDKKGLGAILNGAAVFTPVPTINIIALCGWRSEHRTSGMNYEEKTDFIDLCLNQETTSYIRARAIWRIVDDRIERGCIIEKNFLDQASYSDLLMCISRLPK